MRGPQCNDWLRRWTLAWTLAAYYTSVKIDDGINRLPAMTEQHNENIRMIKQFIFTKPVQLTNH